jgi:hypothetical protein
VDKGVDALGGNVPSARHAEAAAGLLKKCAIESDLQSDQWFGLQAEC